MKISFPLLLIFNFLFFTDTKGQDYDNAGVYMSYISKQQENVSKKFLSYVSASAHGKKARKVDNLRQKLMNEVQEARSNIFSLPTFKGDKSYRDSAVSFMKLYYNILNDDYTKIINLEDIAEQSYDDMEAYILLTEMINKKMHEGNEMLNVQQKLFGSKNNINIVEDKTPLGEMMKQIGDMNVYYHNIYLKFFRPFKQEEYLLEAMSKGNITGMEQSRNSLNKYASEGLESLKNVKPFNGDNSLLGSCRNILNFYVKEAGRLSSSSEYFLAKERFEAVKKEFEKKRSPSREDIDSYNKAVNEYNKANQVYNNENNNLNQMRSEALKNWNNSIKEFFDNNTPHYK